MTIRMCSKVLELYEIEDGLRCIVYAVPLSNKLGIRVYTEHKMTTINNNKCYILSLYP